MKRPVVIVATHNRMTTICCPRCGAKPGKGMAITEAVLVRRPGLLMALATCQCGKTTRVYWRAIAPAAVGSPVAPSHRPYTWPPLDGGRGA